MKKITALFLTLALVLVALSGCGGKSQTSQPEHSDDNSDYQPPQDTVVLASGWAETWYNRPSGTQAYSDLWGEAVKKVEKKYKIKIKVQYLDFNNLDIIARAISAGSAPYDMIEMQIASARKLALNNVLYDQASMTKLDLSSEAFKQCKAIGEAVSFNGKQYASLFGYPYSTISGVFVNKDVLKKYSQPDIQSLVDSKEWTFAKYKEIANSIYKKSGGTVFGTAAGVEMIGVAMTSNAKGTVIRDNGKYICAGIMQPGIDACKWIQDMYINDKSLKYITTGMRDSFQYFMDNKAAFVPATLEMCEMLINAESDWTFVPFPIGPDQSEYLIGTYSGKCFAMPATVKNPEFIGEVYNAIGKEMYSGIKKMYENMLSDYGMDDAGCERAMNMAQYIVPEFAEGIDVSGHGNQINGAVFSASGDITKVFNSISSIMENAVSDYYGSVSQ